MLFDYNKTRRRRAVGPRSFLLAFAAILSFFLRSCNSLPDSDKDAALLSASEQGNLAEVRRLLKANADVNARNRSSSTPLHLAATQGHLEVVRELLREGGLFSSKKMPNVDSLDQAGKTPLWHASSNCRLGIVRMLIEHGANLNASDKNYLDAPLHVAINNECYSVANALIAAGASVDALNSNGESPLHLAAFTQRYDIVERLIAHGADVNQMDAVGNTPLHSAAVGRGGSRMIALLLAKNRNINPINSFGRTPLHLAAEEGYLEVMRFLVDAGANVNARDHKTKTDPMLRYSIEPDNHNNVTPLHLAAKAGHVQCVQFLIDHGALLNQKDSEGWTELHYGVWHFQGLTLLPSLEFRDKHELLRLLIEKGAKVNERDHRGYTPLHLATAYGTVEEMRALLEGGADTSMRTSSGYTPLGILTHPESWRPEIQVSEEKLSLLKRYR